MRRVITSLQSVLNRLTNKCIEKCINYVCADRKLPLLTRMKFVERISVQASIVQFDESTSRT